ncbi:MAG: AraC family transcriptional regulator [Oscillospiraceae bacterium]|nr:AraC family transcriptional regulator [Oscillospiraceae bacterium]
MEWLKKMNSVLGYIEDNLDGDIDDNKVAMLSATPKGVFQRVFSTMTDMTLSEYTRKRKLTLAASDIQNTDDKIIDIAVKYGYNSANAFTSAFKSYHGVTPSYARKSDTQLQAFQRLAFTLSLSVKGGNDMQYRTIKNVEDFLQQMANKEHHKKHLQIISDHNGAKCVLDGIRAAVILPEGTADWDLSDAYFDTGDKEKPTVNLSSIFIKSDFCFELNVAKAQIESLINSFDDYKMKLDALIPEIIFIDINKMAFVTKSEAMELKDKENERIMAFQPKYLKETLDFIVCSECDVIEIYFNNKTITSNDGKLGPIIMKSGNLYAAILPVCIASFFKNKFQ